MSDKTWIPSWRLINVWGGFQTRKMWIRRWVEQTRIALYLCWQSWKCFLPFCCVKLSLYYCLVWNLTLQFCLQQFIVHHHRLQNIRATRPVKPKVEGSIVSSVLTESSVVGIVTYFGPLPSNCLSLHIGGPCQNLWTHLLFFFFFFEWNGFWYIKRYSNVDISWFFFFCQHSHEWNRPVGIKSKLWRILSGWLYQLFCFEMPGGKMCD